AKDPRRSRGNVPQRRVFERSELDIAERHVIVVVDDGPGIPVDAGLIERAACGSCWGPGGGDAERSGGSAPKPQNSPVPRLTLSSRPVTLPACNSNEQADHT